MKCFVIKENLLVRCIEEHNECLNYVFYSSENCLLTAATKAPKIKI